MTVAPGDAPQFEAAMLKYIEASKLAEIPEEFLFDVYQENDRYLMVSFPENMATFDEPEEAWVARFMGTPGEALVLEAFGIFGAFDVVEVEISGVGTLSNPVVDESALNDSSS